MGVVPNYILLVAGCLPMFSEITNATLISQAILCFFTIAISVLHFLHHRMKELELEDRQYEIDKELYEIGQIPRKYNNILVALHFLLLFVMNI